MLGFRLDRPWPLATAALLVVGCSGSSSSEGGAVDSSMDDASDASSAQSGNDGTTSTMDGATQDADASVSTMPEAGPDASGAGDAPLEGSGDVQAEAHADGSTDASPPLDAPGDAVADASVDAASDAVAEASFDASPDAVAEASFDAPAESGDGAVVCSPGASLVLNGDFSLGNTDFTSDYSYVSQINAETQYTINSNPGAASIWGGGWASPGTPTPTDGGSGNLLVVNGATTAGQFLWRQTITVSPGTNYQISFWAVAVDGTPYASLQAMVNGAQVGNTLNVSSSWTQAATVWNSGSATSAIFGIVDSNLSAGNNDFAVDDISFAQCH